MRLNLLPALVAVSVLGTLTSPAWAQVPTTPADSTQPATTPTTSSTAPMASDTVRMNSVPRIDSTAPGQQIPPMGQGMGNEAGRPGAAVPRVGGSEDSPRGNGKIVGIVVDSTTGKPVEFASIALINPETNRPVDGAVADDKGRFTMNRLPKGDFRVLVSFVGYKNLMLQNIRIADRGDDINLGSVRLLPEVRLLKEVTVTGQSAMVEEKVDRLVYNAEKDLTAKGGDATDVMRKVPMLSVDLDGNVSLRGSSNVRVLINNKPSTIVASSVADALKQIPAEMIKTVEVITSPSAKYDAEGSAGIINIITKKNTLQGLTLNLDSGVGNRGANLGLQGNLRTGKMGFSLNGFGRTNYNVRGNFRNEQTTGGIRSVQTADTYREDIFGSYQLGWDYDINKNTSITASARYGIRNRLSEQNKLTTTTVLPTTTQIGVRDVDIKDLSGTVDVNVDFTRTYKPQQELSILTLYSRNNRTNNFIATIFDSPAALSILNRERNDNTSRNQETTFQVDYQTPVKTNQLIEFGGKVILRQVNSDFAYLLATGENGTFTNNPRRQPNGLDYDQNVAAGYVSYTYTSKTKYSIKVGSRYEYTMIDARFRNITGDALTTQVGAIPNYGNLVPSINLSKSLKGGKSIKLAYNRRLQRPGIQFLNPNLNAANPQNITKGNPLLSPELTDNFEFSNSFYIKQVYINASVFARFTDNSIEAVRDTIQSPFSDPTNPALQRVLQTTFANIGQQNSYGLNLFGNATLFSKWQIGGGGDVYYATLSNNSPNPALRASNSGWVVTGRFFTSVQLKNGWGVQGFGFARGRQIQLQGYEGGFLFYSLGLKKDFKNKRGSVGLAGENFFNHPFTIRSESNSALFSQSQVQNLYNAGIRVNFNYRFGKMSFDGGGFGGKRKKSVNNDDLKEGENGGGQQGGGQPSTPPAGGGGRGPR